MSKLLVMPKNIDIKSLDKYTDGYILGLKSYSVNIPCEITIDEIKDLREKTDKEIFIAINKNLFTRDVEDLKELLKEIDKLDIKGILYASKKEHYMLFLTC